MVNEDDPRYRLEYNREKARDELESADAEAVISFSRVIDPEEMSISGPKKSVSTVKEYTQCLRILSRDFAPAPLLELSQDALTDVVSELSDEYAPSTVGQYQSALKLFYKTQGDGGVDPEAINVVTSKKTSVDERTVLTRDEFFAIRDATENPRDRCFVDLLGFTGQRVRVIQALRIRDVDPHEGRTGVYHVNTDVEGLKGVSKTMRKRPLLGAKRSVLDMLEYHPTGEPDDYLLTVLPSASRGTPGAMWSQSTMRLTLDKLAERAGVEKPTNPHSFRHFFVTAAKRDYGMDSEDIKALLGHSPRSNVMETTYSHLSDEDTIEGVESAFGVEGPDDDTDGPGAGESRLTPPTCPECFAPVPDGARACHCGYAFTPDATDRISELEETVERLSELLD